MTLAYRQRRHGENVAESSYTLLRRWEPANLIGGNGKGAEPC